MKFVAVLLPAAIAIAIGCGSGRSQSGDAAVGGSTVGTAGAGGTAGASAGSGGMSGSGGAAGASATGGGAGSAAGTGGGAGRGGSQAGASGAGGAAGGRGGSTGLGGSGTAGEPGAFCTPAWCWSYPLPQGEQLTVIWADRAGRTAIAGGFGGALMRWNGSGWQDISTDLIGGAGVSAIWGSGPNDVWAAMGPLLFRFDGTSWRQAAGPPPAVAGTSPYFYSISGSGPDDVWFASTEAAYHWTASGWAAQAYLLNHKLTFVSAASPTEVWATEDKHVYRWNGTDFAEVAWPRADPLFQGVFAFGQDDVWVNSLGEYSHWDGRQFTVESGVRTTAGFYDYHALFITTPGDVWAISAHRLSPGNWSSVPVDPDPGSVPYLGAASLDGQIWLAGNRGRLWRYQNNRFALTVPAVDTAKLRDLSAIWSDGNGTVLAAGANLLRNVGNGWELAPFDIFAGSVNAMWGRSANDVWAVGNNAAVYHYDGNRWSIVTTGVSSAQGQFLDLYAVGGTDTGEVWAVGYNGQALHFDGQAWTAGPSASASDMRALWVHNADDVWVCGDNGSVQRWTRAGGWALLSARPAISQTYQTIWGTSETNVWILSGGSSVFRYDGATWRTQTLPASLRNHYVFALSGNPDGTFWASGEAGFTMRWNGSAFQGFPARTSQDLNAIWVGPTGEAWAAGKKGVIFHHR